MKITLILAASLTDPLRKNDPFMPLAMPLLAASAPEHDYTFVDMLSGETAPFDIPTDLVGISVRLTAEETAFSISKQYRDLGVPVVLGGPQISSIPFDAKRYADSVVIGEGEQLWPILLQDFENTKKLKDFYVSSPEIFDGNGFSVYQLYDHLDLHKVPLSIEQRGLYKKKYVFDTVFASRGCPIDCDFCSVSHLFGQKTRLRKIEDVVKEIGSFKGYYYLLDDTVFGRPKTYNYYLDLYEALSRLDKVRYWTGQANLDAASTEQGRKVIRAASKSGLIYASIGIESIDPKVQKKSGSFAKMGIGTSNDAIAKMKDNIAFIQDQGIAVSGWFTIGYEEDTLDTIDRSLDFCKETNIIPILSHLEALPGTRLYKRLEAEGMLSKTEKLNIKHPSLSAETILKALDVAMEKGFSMGQILKRTDFYRRKFASNSVGVSAIIEKTIFVFVLQNKLKKGVLGLANYAQLNPKRTRD